MPIPPQWGGFAYGGSPLGRAGRDGSGLSVAGYNAVYYLSVRDGSSAYGQASYGGRRAVSLPAAGILAIADADAGVVNLPLWWAYAASVTVNRRGTDGSLTPVRSSPVTLDPSQSRTSLAYNPKMRDSLTGYTAGANTTLTRLVGQATPADLVTTALRATATAAGQVLVTAANEPVATLDRTYGQWVRTSATASAIQLSVTWYDRDSTSLGTTNYPVAATARTQAVNAWSWAPVSITTRPSGAVTGVLAYVATGLPAGGRLDITGRIVEDFPALRGDYFDGDYPGAAWNGDAGLSFSSVSPIVYIVDTEAPLDAPVTYELTYGLAPGFVASTERVTLSSGPILPPRDAFLTHPGMGQTVRVWVEAEPEITRPINRSEFQVIGRRRTVVVTDPQRGSDTGALTFITEGIDERTRLLAMLDDGSPLLLRAPADYGHPPNWWLSFGDVSIVAPDNGVAAYDLRRITADFTEVDRPTTATRPLVA